MDEEGGKRKMGGVREVSKGQASFTYNTKELEFYFESYDETLKC